MSRLPKQASAASRFEVYVPRFIKTHDRIGLGDVVQDVTRRLNVPNCSGCSKRAEILNSFVSFKGSRDKSA